jgi:hypothetical protein
MNLEYVVVNDDESCERGKCGLLCASETRNTEFSVHKFGGLKRRNGYIRGRETLRRLDIQNFDKCAQNPQCHGNDMR